MLNPDSPGLQPSLNLDLSVALVRIGLHAHDANGTVAAEIGQPLDGLVLDGCEAAQDVSLPQIADTGLREPALHGFAVEDGDPAIRARAHID